MNAPNLTQHPPRSPRVRLGGYTILPRLLDKARAVIAGTAGEYRTHQRGGFRCAASAGLPAKLGR